MTTEIEFGFGTKVFVNDLRKYGDEEGDAVLQGRVLKTRTFGAGTDEYLSLTLESGYEVVIKGIKKIGGEN